MDQLQVCFLVQGVAPDPQINISITCLYQMQPFRQILFEKGNRRINGKPDFFTFQQPLGDPADASPVTNAKTVSPCKDIHGKEIFHVGRRRQNNLCPNPVC